MPRTSSNRGGSREGTAGKAYPERTDLNEKKKVQPARSPKGLPQGEATRRISAQQALPLPAAADPSTLPSLSAPSQRPGEPVTAGLPIGAGPGPEATVLGGASPEDSVIQLLQQLYAEFPTPELQKYIETAQAANHPTTVTGAQGFSPYIPRAQRARMIPPVNPLHPSRNAGQMGTTAGVQAGFQGAPPGLRTGRIAAREGMQLQGQEPDSGMIPDMPPRMP